LTGRPRARSSRILVAGALALVGLVWLGQGLGYIPGSFMTGDPFWAVAGVVLLILAAAMLALELGRRSSSPR